MQLAAADFYDDDDDDDDFLTSFDSLLPFSLPPLLSISPLIRSLTMAFTRF